MPYQSDLIGAATQLGDERLLGFERNNYSIDFIFSLLVFLVGGEVVSYVASFLVGSLINPNRISRSSMIGSIAGDRISSGGHASNCHDNFYQLSMLEHVLYMCLNLQNLDSIYLEEK